MGFSYNVNVLNQKGSPALYTDIFANRPAAGYQGRLFVSTDTAAIYEDTGTAWTLIANVSSGAGTLQQVTTNGNTSNVGISITAGGVSTNSLTDTSLTTGSVPFAGAGGLISQDNANLFWDDTNNRLGINTNTPGNSLDVHSAGTNPILALNNTAGNQSAVSFLNTSVAKWRIGNTATNTLDIYNFTLAVIALQIKANNNAVFISSVQGDEFTVQPTGYSILASLSRNLTGAGYGVLSLRNSANGTIQPSTLSVDRTYTLPDATGTIALTSDLSAYLPLAGGTMSNTINSTLVNGIILNANSATTQANYIQVANSVGNARYGIDSSVGGSLGSGTSANSAVFGNAGNAPLDLTTQNISRIKILATGTILGNKLTVTPASLSALSLQSENELMSTGSFAGVFWESRSGGVTATSNWYGWYATGGTVFLFNGSANIASVNTVTGVYTPLSDINKKKDFEDSTIGLNAILNLKPTLYRMLDEENTDKHLGFIAQEVKEFIPQAYVESGEDNDKFIGLDYQAITSTLVKAVQEQQTIINNLLQRIEFLENKV